MAVRQHHHPQGDQHHRHQPARLLPQAPGHSGHLGELPGQQTPEAETYREGDQGDSHFRRGGPGEQGEVDADVVAAIGHGEHGHGAQGSPEPSPQRGQRQPWGAWQRQRPFRFRAGIPPGSLARPGLEQG